MIINWCFYDFSLNIKNYVIIKVVSAPKIINLNQIGNVVRITNDDLLDFYKKNKPILPLSITQWENLFYWNPYFPNQLLIKKVEKKVVIELKYTAFGKKKKVVEIDFQRLFKLYYLTSVSVMYDLVTFMIDRNVDFMGFSTFQLLMK